MMFYLSLFSIFCFCLCFDQLFAFTIDSKDEIDCLKSKKCCEGYEMVGEVCKAKCSNCVHGHCVNPNECSCLPNFGGKNCTTKCSTGKFGLNCEWDCNCLTDRYCNKNYVDCNCSSNEINENCTNICKCLSNRCKPGYQGANCDIPCDTFTFGNGCTGKCQCIKENSIDCSRKNGDCICKAGYFGIHCENTCLWGNLNCDSKQRCECRNGMNTNDIIATAFANFQSNSNAKTENGTKEFQENILDFYSLITIVFIVAIILILSFLVYKYKKKADQFDALVNCLNESSSDPEICPNVFKTPEDESVSSV